MICNKPPTIILNLLPYLSKCIGYFIFCPSCFCRVGEVVMTYVCFCWKVRTVLFGIVANRDDKVEVDVVVFVDVVRSMRGNVYAVFTHARNGSWIYPVGFHTGAIDIGFLFCKMPQIALRHLTSTAVARAKHQYFCSHF